MAPAKSPTVRQRRLARELRQLREQRDLRIGEVTKHLDWSDAKLSRIETGKVRVTLQDVKGLLEVYEITGQHHENLLTLTREARQRPWWSSFSDVFNEGLETAIGLEQEALAINTYDAQLISGLLQTEEYATAVIRSVSRSSDPAFIARRVALRMERQSIFSADSPPQLWSIVDESALMRRVGGRQVMLDQLERLRESTGSPHVTVQILPLSAGAHAGSDGGFYMLTLPDPDQEIVFLESALGQFPLEAVGEVEVYRRTLERLRATARGPEETADRITDIMKGI